MTLAEIIETVRNMVAGENRIEDFTALSVAVAELLPKLQEIENEHAEELGESNTRIAELETERNNKDAEISELQNRNREIVERYGKAIVDGVIRTETEVEKEVDVENNELDELVKRFD